MPTATTIRSGITVLQLYRLRSVFIIAFIWTLADLTAKLLFSGVGKATDDKLRILTPEAAWVRVVIVFSASALMAYHLVFRLRGAFRDMPLWKNWLSKTGMLVAGSIAMNFLIHLSYYIVVWDEPISKGLYRFWNDSLHSRWLLEKSLAWMAVFILTQLFLEVNEKYGPGVFLDILLGRYINPRQEHRIVLFLDLKDSTPIAESLGTKVYFSFIRDFIFYVSSALVEYNGNIYQYVGDEIVASWKCNPRNAQKCLSSLLEARRMLQLHSAEFRRKYGIVPEFRAGIHAGELTIGEIGVVKKDIAMSGDTMNTAARIRTASSELRQKFLVSQAFMDLLNLKDWQTEAMGSISLKGKSDGVALYALKV
jgi:adenylate cyclase